jgi:hypothetical protein
MDRPSEATEYHTRLLKCSLEVEHCRAYWQHVEWAASGETAQIAFAEYWFGARSKPRVSLLLANLRERFDQFPPALAVLHRWNSMDAGTRRLICHWHLQLADRLYREFTGGYLVQRAVAGRTDVTRDLVVRWIDQLAPERWTTSTRIQFARKLLYSATEAGLLKESRGPRQLQNPRVGDDALGYILHLLRSIHFQGTLTQNPYLSSLGIGADDLQRRLRALPAIGFRRQGELFEFAWTYHTLDHWAEATVLNTDRRLRGTA